VIFRLFKANNVNTFQAIVFNYVIAFSVGFLFFGENWSSNYIEAGEWQPYALIIGVLFISLFLLMGKSAQENGIGITSVTVKMSLVIPVIFAIWLYQESIFLTKVIGIVLALVGVFLITYQKKSEKQSNAKNLLFLIILFVGSGILDATINFVEKKALGDLSPALFTAIGFGIAGTIGLIVLMVALLLKKQKIRLKNIIGGIVLGIPNFFSIYFLIMAIRAPLDDSITYALNNVGIVLFSYLLGIILFKESTSRIKIIGGIVAVASIVLMSL
jgi:drug/metabolite transporter (DMT)-like permease